MRIIVFTLASLCISLFSSQVFAQALLDDTSISADVVPSSPKEFEQVTITLKSFSIDIDTANISWTLDGVRTLSGIGEKRFSFTTKALGERSLAIATINVFGQQITQRFEFIPTDIDLLYEGVDSYTPPFFKGLPLPASESAIKVIAIPHLIQNGRRVAQNTLVYNWRREDRYRDFYDDSGYGKSSLIVGNLLNREVEEIGVDVTTRGGDLGGKASVSIFPVIPQIRIYEDRPTEGTLYQSSNISGALELRDTVRLIAEPFYFSIKNPFEEVSLRWYNNREYQSGEKNVFTLRREALGNDATVRVYVENPGYLIQNTNTSIRVTPVDE